jgi:hypothetical protein
MRGTVILSRWVSGAGAGVGLRGGEPVASSKSVSGKRVLAGMGSLRRTGSQCLLVCPFLVALVGWFSLLPGTPKLGARLCLAKVTTPRNHRARSFAQKWCLPSPNGWRVFSDKTHSLRRSGAFRRRVFARPTALGSLWVAGSSWPEGSGISKIPGCSDLDLPKSS